MEVAAGGLATWLFDYNRKNFMFNGEQQIKREYQGQGMAIKQFELYREDVRELINLTVGKMDNYLIVATLFLGLCVTLFAEGRPKASVTDFWMAWLYSVTLVSAFVYFLLSAWLAMHASIAAQSYGVRLLTQVVRLPVPSSRQIDAARARAVDYERQRMGEIFRIPVAHQQLRKMVRALDSVTVQDSQSDAGSDDGLGSLDAGSAAGTGATTPAAMLKHLRLFRELQANWQAYDAYARVCIFNGLNHFLHALSHYCLCLFVATNNDPLTGLTCAVILAMVAWLVVRLDLYMSRHLLGAAAGLLTAPPLLAACVVVAEKSGASKDACLLIVPFIFVVEVVWIVFIVCMAKPDHVSGVAIPTRFRGVLYLDVFGWLLEPSRGPEAAPAVPHGAQATHRGAASADAGAGSRPPPQAHQRTSSTEDGDMLETEIFMREVSDGSFLRRVSDGSVGRKSGVMSPDLRASLWVSCCRLRDGLRLDFDRWESKSVQDLLDRDAMAKQAIAQLRTRFDEVTAEMELEELELQTSSGSQQFPVDAPSSSDDVAVWLRLEWDLPGQRMVFYYRCETGETMGAPPQGDNVVVTDLSDLQRRLKEFVEKVRALVGSGLPFLPVSSMCNLATDTALDAGDAPPPDSGAAVQPPRQDGGDASSRSENSAPLLGARSAREVANAPRTESADAQATHLGGHEAAHLAEGSVMRERFLVHSADAAATFHPRDRLTRAPRSRKPPGQMPWKTFWQGSVVLILVWSVGVLWISVHVFLQIDLPKLPSSPVQFGSRSIPLAIAFAGPWQHAFMTPRGLACDPALGRDVLLVAEAHAVHEVRLGVQQTQTRLQPAIAACLARAPTFKAGGLRSISVDCSGFTQDSGLNRRGRGAGCVALLLGAEGGDVLQCPLDTGLHDTDDGAMLLLRVRGGRWRTLTPSKRDRTFWAIRHGEAALVQWRRRLGTETELVPEVEVRRKASANVEQLHLHDGATLLGLEALGRLHAWRTDGASLGAWGVQADARFAGVCSIGEALYVVGADNARSGALTVWNASLPLEFHAEGLRNWHGSSDRAQYTS